MGEDELTPLQMEFEARKKKTPLQEEFDAQKRAALPAPPPIAQADAARDAAAVVQAPGEGKTGDFQKARDLAAGLAISAPTSLAEAPLAGIRSVVRRQPYSEALSDIRTVTDPIPLPLKLAVQAPAILATGRLPISPAKAGAAFGGLSQLLNADPQSLAERAGRTAVGAAAGGAVGKALDIGGTLGRAWLVSKNDGRWRLGRPSSGEVTQKVEAKMRKADRTNYGDATKEGAASLRQIAGVRKILDRPNVKPFAADVRNSEKFAGASDAEVLGEVYSSMGSAERSLKQSLAREYNADISRRLAGIVQAKRDLMKEADKFMPSFRPAVLAHAKAEGEMAAVGTGVNAAKRAMGATPGGKNLRRESVEKYAERIREMSPENKKRAIQGVLSELRQRTGFQPNAISLGGLLTSIQRPMKMARFLRNAGDEGQALADALVRQFLAGGSTAGR